MTTAPQFQSYLDNDYNNLDVDLEDITISEPPTDDSHTTRMELEELEHIVGEAKLPREIMHVADRDPLRLFYSVAKKKGLDPLEEEAEEWADDWTKLSFEFKLKFKRRRPWEVKKEHDIDFVVNKSDTTESPSYPSGHAMMGYGVAEFYKDKYPLMADEWDNVAEIIAHSRLQMGVHYPSDVEASKKLVKQLVEQVKEASFGRFVRAGMKRTLQSGKGVKVTTQGGGKKVIGNPNRRYTMKKTTTPPATQAPTTTAPATPQTWGQRAKSWGSSVGNFASQNPMQATAIAGATGVGGFMGAKKLMQPKPTTQMPKFGSLGHLEQRRSERAKFMSKEDLASLEKKVRRTKDLPEGAHYITLPHGRKGVVRTEEGKSHLATILDARMRPPGRDISSKVKTAAEKLRLYHGSPLDLETLEPRQPNKGRWGEPGLYGTPNPLVAALYAIARNDSKGSWGVLPDGRLIAKGKKELNPEGYVYEYDSDDYIPPPEDDPGIGYAAQGSPEILSKEKVYLDNLRDSITRVDDKDKFLEYFRKTSNLKKKASDLSVLTAVPTQNLDKIMRKGLYSQKAMLDDPEVMAAFLAQRNADKAWKNDEQYDEKRFREQYDKRVKLMEGDDSPLSGPSVFFTEPDPDKVSDPRHFVNKFDTQKLRVNLGKLLADIPETRITGAELIPSSAAENMTDEEFDQYVKDRRRDITPEEAAKYIATDPKELWKHYKDEYLGRYYAADVPHAFIRTPSGIIPPEYLEQVEKTSSDLESQFQPDLTPDALKALGVYDQVYGDAPSEASMKEWPEHWINKQDPLGWLQWYDRYSEGRRTDDDERQMKRWKSFKARHLAQYLKKPTPRRAAALRNWGIDVEKY